MPVIPALRAARFELGPVFDLAIDRMEEAHRRGDADQLRQLLHSFGRDPHMGTLHQLYQSTRAGDSA